MRSLIHCDDSLNFKAWSWSLHVKSQLHPCFLSDSLVGALQLASLVEVRVVYSGTPAPCDLCSGLWERCSVVVKHGSDMTGHVPVLSFSSTESVKT